MEDDNRPALRYGDLNPDNRRDVTREDMESDWSDWLTLGKSVLQKSVADMASGVEYLTDGEVGGDTRRQWNKDADETNEYLTPAMRKSIGAALIPGEGETSYLEAGLGRTLAAKGYSGLVSFVPYVLGAAAASYAAGAVGVGAAGSALIGGATARGLAGLQQTGDVAGKIYEFIEKQSDEQLQADSEAYRDYRKQFDEKEARRRYMQDVAGIMPAAAGIITAAMGGAEGMAGARVGGAKALGWKEGAKHGIKAEGKQEAVEGLTSEGGSQYQLIQAGLMKQADWRKIVNETLESGLIGGLVGGVTGAATNIRRSEKGVTLLDDSPVTPDQAVALGGEQGSPLAAPAERQTSDQDTVSETTEQPQIEDISDSEKSLLQSRALTILNLEEQDLRRQKTILRQMPDDGLTLKNIARIEKFLAENTIDTLTQRLIDNAVRKKNGLAPDAPVVFNKANNKTVPEKPETLQDQQDKLVNGEVPAMLFTKGDEELALPEGMERVETPDGVVHFDPYAYTADQILRLSKAGRINDVLGYVQSKEDVANKQQQGIPAVAVTERAPDGTERRAAATSLDRVQEQVDQFVRQASPDSTVRTETAEGVLAGRQVPDDVAGAMRRQTQEPIDPNAWPQEYEDAYNEYQDEKRQAAARAEQDDRVAEFNRIKAEQEAEARRQQEEADYDEAWYEYQAEKRMAREQEAGNLPPKAAKVVAAAKKKKEKAAPLLKAAGVNEQNNAPANTSQGNSGGEASLPPKAAKAVAQAKSKEKKPSKKVVEQALARAAGLSGVPSTAKEGGALKPKRKAAKSKAKPEANKAEQGENKPGVF